MPILLETPYVTVSIDPDASIVRTIRSERAFPSDADFIDTQTEALRAYETLDRKSMGHLIDLRLSPMNNDPRFEEATKPLREASVREFACVAFLVRTAVGALNVNRLVRESDAKVDMPVFHEEAAALAHLFEVLKRPPGSSTLTMAAKRSSSRPRGGP